MNAEEPTPSAPGGLTSVAAAAAAGAAKGGVSGAALGAARQVTLSTLRDPKRRSRLAWIAALLVGLLLFPLMMVFFAFGAGSSPSGSHANSSIAGSRAVKAGVTRENIEIARRVGLRVGVSWEVLSSLVLVQAQGVSTVVSAGTGATTAASTGPAATDWRVPVVGSYVVTSPFGMRIHPILEIAKLHTGVDLVMKPAPGDVVAAASGTVLWAKPSGAYGNQVAVDHGGGVTTSYSHLASFAPGIAPGVPVSAGQVVGQEGTTGRSTGPHLHFEVRLAGVPVDPVPFMAQHGVTIGSGGSGGAGTGTGTSTGWGMSITGIGPLKINPGSEPPDATDMEAALLWAARAMKEKLPDNIDISSGMVVSDIDAVIDTGNAEATAVRQDYLNGLKALPVGGMSATRANQIYDQAIAWRLGKDYVNPNYGISCDVSAFGSLTVTDGAGRTFTLGPTELGHVATMVTVAKQAGLSERAMIAAAMAMGQESGFVNLASRKVPDSLNYPHDDVAAGNAASIGLFQQQVGMGWGTTAQIMDPVHAAQAFFGISDAQAPGLTDLAAQGLDIENGSLGDIVQAVQRSGFPRAYDKWEPVAKAAVGAVAGVACATSFATPADASAAAKTIIDAAKAWLGTTYSYGGGDLNGPTLGINQGRNTVGFDCSGLTRYAYNKGGISLPRTAHSQYLYAASTRGINTDPANVGIGELVFFGTSANVVHVGIFIGNGQYLHAPRTGDVVKVSDLAGWRLGDFVGSSKLLG